MGISIVPGFDTEKKQLTRLLKQASELSRALKLLVNQKNMEAEFSAVAEQLDNMLLHQTER